MLSGTPIRLLLKHPQDIPRRSSEHLDARGGCQRPGVGLSGAVTDDAHVNFHRCRVRMDLDDRHADCLLFNGQAGKLGMSCYPTIYLP